MASAFDRFVVQNQKRAASIAFRMLGNWEDARDHAQDAFVRFLRLPSPPLAEKERVALLMRILINGCIDTLRKKKRFRASTLDENQNYAGLSNNPAQTLKTKEMQSRIETAARALKPKQRAVFVLRDIEGYSVRETAELLNCKENSVLINLHLARKNLRKALAPYLKNENLS